MQTLFVNFNDTRLTHDDTKLNLSIDTDNGTTQSKTSTNLAGSVTAKNLIQRGESIGSFFLACLLFLSSAREYFVCVEASPWRAKD